MMDTKLVDEKLSLMLKAYVVFFGILFFSQVQIFFLFVVVIFSVEKNVATVR